MSLSEDSDKIMISGLHVRSVCGVDHWEHIKRQPINLTICLHSDISNAGDSDVLAQSISYSDVAKRIQEFVEVEKFRSLEGLANAVSRLCIREYGVNKVSVNVEKPKGLLHAIAGVQVVRSNLQFDALDSSNTLPSSDVDVVFVRNLTLDTVVGVNPWEREERQKVVVSLTLQYPIQAAYLAEDKVPSTKNYRVISRLVTEFVENSRFQTVEALATSIAKLCVIDCKVPKVHVRLEKPSALLYADAAIIEITRDANSFGVKPIVKEEQKFHTCFVAFGSNMGDRYNNISKALSLLGRKCKVLDTSFLYETAPMYVEDQDKFVNGVCKVSTSLSPQELLQELKKIEQELGRTPTIRFGPRTVDLDILLYDDLELESKNLQIPHPRMQEREFVLKPLADIAPHLEHPSLYRTISGLLAIQKHNQGKSEVVRVMALGSQLWAWGQKTMIMGILNVTPDSFSDGGSYDNVEKAVVRVREMIEQGVDIVDVGGMSTRPNAPEISEQEELNRVVPVIKAIREAGLSIPISIDTFRARVALESVQAGANMINDVSGGTRDVEMLKVMAETGVAVCLMHMRGDSRTMTKLTDYGHQGVVKEVARSLTDLVDTAIANGVHRWNIVIDPGIGFAKDAQQNLDLLRHLSVFKQPPLTQLPLLIGVSRKAFIGRLTGQSDPQQRVWGTAAACSAAIGGGADILRVHDVKEMVDVAKVADSLWK